MCQSIRRHQRQGHGHGDGIVKASSSSSASPSPPSSSPPPSGDDVGYAAVPVDRLRNFSIIAHIDHGKSTLADRLLEVTGTIAKREMQNQFLDSMDLERERGITIKLQAARMRHTDGASGLDYALNLIDTPGHVDFSYEVSRSLMACEGALLVVDASQGVEAQTLANVYLAMANDLEVIPVINKIDLPGADVDRVVSEIEEVIGLDCSGAVLCSAKQGLGIDDILNAVVQRIPPPEPNVDKPLRALVFDSYYDPYKGVIVYFRIVDGSLQRGDKVLLMASQSEHVVDELGVLAPKQTAIDSDLALSAGEVGYLAASIKTVADARVGDTITLANAPASAPLPGYEEAKPMVFCGLFPVDNVSYPDLREALGKLQLNDAALTFEPESSAAMGYGFRCGFLGLLHMEIIQERLEREYDLDLITTAPAVVYRVETSDGEVVMVDNPSQLPDVSKRVSIAEPYVKLEVISPRDHVGNVMDLLSNERRALFKDMRYLNETRAALVFDMPLAEVVTDLFDELKSRTRGYASMDYSLLDYRTDDLVKLEIKINSEAVDPLAIIVHRDKAYPVGKALALRLKQLIPKQQFRVPIQAAIGSRVVASESVPALRKDVLAKCYGGDISRKKKLLKKQAKGKKRMKSLGKVDVPQEAFMAVLNLSKSETDQQ